MKLLKKNLLLITSLCFLTVLFNNANASAQSENLISGTAFAVSFNGHLLTAHHVIKHMKEVLVKDPHTNEKLQAQLIAKNEQSDIALLWVKGLKTIPVTISLENIVENGQAVFAMGFSKKNSTIEIMTMATGVVSSSPAIENHLVFKHTADVSPGQSGGAVFSESGEIIGMVLARMPKAEILESQEFINNSVALDVKQIHKFINLNLTPHLSKATYPLPFIKIPIPEVGSELVEFNNIVFNISGKVNQGTSISTNLGVKNSALELLATLSSDMRRKFFGAYLAGYKEFVKIDAGILMLSPESVERSGLSIVKAKVLISLEKPQFTSNGIIYFSSVNDIYYKCDSNEMALFRKEFKKDSFGVGETIQAFKHRVEINLPFKQISTMAINNFFQTYLCNVKEGQ